MPGERGDLGADVACWQKHFHESDRMNYFNGVYRLRGLAPSWKGMPCAYSVAVVLVLFGLAPTAQAMTDIRIPAKVCDVTTYGANGERQQILLNTAPIQQAIDDCAAAGGGTVLFPAGNYLSEPLVLKSHIRLQLEKGATLVASTTESSYKAASNQKYAQAENGWLPFISVPYAHNVAISGEGTIDGQGAVWWERWRSHVRAAPSKRGTTDRPRLIYISHSSNVVVEGVMITHSPSFHVVMRDSEDIDVTRTRIYSPAHAPHTDAIDPINSRHIRITHNVIDNNDDHVAIKADKWDSHYPDGVTSDIYIAHNTLRGGRGISIGSESSGGVSNVLVEHNRFEGSMYGFRIKSPRGKGGKVHNITYRDTTMVNVGVPLIFSGYYKSTPEDPLELKVALANSGFVVGDQLYPPDSDPALPFAPLKTPHFSAIRIINLVSTGKSKAAGFIVGVPEAPLTDFRFENVHIEADRGLVVRNASLHTLKFKLKVGAGDELLLQKGGHVASAHNRTFVYVSNAVSKTIMVAELDIPSGNFTPRQTVSVDGMVMPLAISPDRRFLFAALRSQPYAVVSFAIDPTNGLLKSVGTFALPESMTSIAIDRTGRLLLAASYGGNMLSVSRISAQGEVLPAHQILKTPPMAHNLQTTLDNRFAFATSLGGDALLQFQLDSVQQVLRINNPAQLALPVQSGPRQMAFDPGGRFVFVMDELDAKVHSLEIDEASGTLRGVASLTSLPAGFTDAPAGADIHVTPNGRFLYTSERGSNTLAGFSVDASNGKLTLLGHWPSEEQPRGFSLDPTGQFLLEAGQRSGMLSVHAIRTDGALEKRGSYTVGQGPNWIEIIHLPQ